MIVIRRAEPADGPALFLLARAFATSFVVEEQAFKRSLAELLSETAAFLAVADHDDTIVGYLLGFDHPSFFANGRVAWVEEIMVSEIFRRQGIGGRLMATFETWARSREAQQIALATRRAAKFYQTLGYEESATYFRKRLN